MYLPSYLGIIFWYYDFTSIYLQYGRPTLFHKMMQKVSVLKKNSFNFQCFSTKILTKLNTFTVKKTNIT